MSTTYHYRAVVDWVDPETGRLQQTEFEASQLSVGAAGRLMATRRDGISHNFSEFATVRLERRTD